MIRHLQRKQIDIKKWDHCISVSAQGMVYAYSWYLDRVSNEWEALVYGDYEMVFPLTWRRKYGIRYLCQPPFSQQLGLFASAVNSTPSMVSSFLDEAAEKFRFMEIHLNTGNRLLPGNYRIRPLITHHLELSASYPEIQRAYSENLRRNLKKAVRKQLEIVKDIPVKSLIPIFRKNRGRRIAALGSGEYRILEELTSEMLRRKCAEVKGVTDASGRLCAGAVFVRSNNKVIFLFSASGPSGLEAGAIPFLIDSVIQKHAESSHVFDFEGSVQPGLARFYKSFGSKECVYLQVRSNRLPRLIRWMK